MHDRLGLLVATEVVVVVMIVIGVIAETMAVEVVGVALRSVTSKGNCLAGL